MIFCSLPWRTKNSKGGFTLEGKNLLLFSFKVDIAEGGFKNENDKSWFC